MRTIFIVLASFVAPFGYAQLVEGVVMDVETKERLQNVRVSPQYSEDWVLTDKEGRFKINAKGSNMLVFKMSGYQEENAKVASGMKVLLNPVSVRIKEVLITSKQRSFSEIEIKEEAIKNTQAFSVADVLTQLPGQFVQSLDNNNFKNIVFRTASGEGINTSGSLNSLGNKAFGVSVMLNDIALSNNENMQSYLPQYGSSFGTGSQFRLVTRYGDRSVSGSQANWGVDLREITIGNIENIVVNQGIPDAKYGDLTSGLIRIETQAGKSPYRLSSSLNAGTYQLNLTKGYQLNKRGDALNIKLNYMNSNPNLRDNLVEYQRVSLGALWGFYSNDKKLYNKFSLDFNKNFDEGRQDPDDMRGTYLKSDKVGFRISNNLRYKFRNDHFLDNLKANVGFSYDRHFSTRKTYVNLGAKPVGDALTNSVYYADYTLPNYFDINNIEGIPINFFSDIDVNKRWKSKRNWLHDWSLGFSWRYSDNIGRGRYGNSRFSGISTAGTTANGFRPYNFEESVPASTQTAVYLQDNISKRFGNNWHLRINAGMRFDIQNKRKNYAPRLNISAKYKNISTRLGLGMTSKSPSLNQLYTGERYLDYLIGDFRLPGYYNVAVMQTFVLPGDNIDLKPSKSWKYEVGLDYQLPFAKFSFTGFYNRLYDGFTSMTKLQKGKISEVNIIYNGTNKPTYDIVGEKDYHYTQNYLTNAMESVDKGIEMGISFKTIKAINLDINVVGSYVKTENYTSVETLRKAKTENEFLYGIYAPTNDAGERLQFSSRFSYHIPRAGLIIGINVENFIIDSNFVEASSKFPIGYVDLNMNSHYIPKSEREDNRYESLFRPPSSSSTIKQGKLLTNAHLRITKDFLNGFQTSIYINNFLNLKPTKEDLDEKKTVVYSNFTPISFGANLSYQF